MWLLKSVEVLEVVVLPDRLTVMVPMLTRYQRSPEAGGMKTLWTFHKLLPTCVEWFWNRLSKVSSVARVPGCVAGGGQRKLPPVR